MTAEDPIIQISRSRFALNAIPWFNLPPIEPGGDDRWLLADPHFRDEYPRVLRELRASGFRTAMLEVHPQMTLQHYRRLLDDNGLTVAPGYAGISLPQDHGIELARGSGDRVRWFDGIRRKAEESNYFGLGTVFLAPAMEWGSGILRTGKAAVGAHFDASRLDQVTDLLGEAASVLDAEGVRAGLHNHIGTWIETEEEIEYVLAAIPPTLLGASFDIGHLAWAGIDVTAMLTRHADRLLDLHIKDLDLSVAAASREHPDTYRSTVRKGVFRELGDGDLDLPAILAALPADWPGWVIVEIDRTELAPHESARRSWEWVEAHTG